MSASCILSRKVAMYPLSVESLISQGFSMDIGVHHGTSMGPWHGYYLAPEYSPWHDGPDLANSLIVIDVNAYTAYDH